MLAFISLRGPFQLPLRLHYSLSSLKCTLSNSRPKLSFAASSAVWFGSLELSSVCLFCSFPLASDVVS